MVVPMAQTVAAGKASAVQVREEGHAHVQSSQCRTDALGAPGVDPSSA